MRSLKLQYFLSFGVLGSWVPVISIYFREQKLTLAQVGAVYAAAGVVLAVAPVLITFLADTRFDPRHVVSVMLTLSGLTLLAVWFAGPWGYPAILATWVIHNACYGAVLPLQDGVNFGIQERRRERGLPMEPYHKTRVWGSVGYIFPSFFLYLLQSRFSAGIALAIGSGFAFSSAVTALLLPRPDTRELNREKTKLPTADAARALLRPPVRIFCVAMFFATLASTVFYPFYPVYLKERIGLPDQWIAPVSAIGVLVELPFILGFGYLYARFGLRRLMLVGLTAMAIRFALLWRFPHPFIAIGTQGLHGLMVLAVVISPPFFINRHAREHYRNSMQGVYALFVIGTGRVVGNFLAGKIANHSPSAELTVFACASALCLMAASLIAIAFYEEEHAHEMKPTEPATTRPA